MIILAIDTSCDETSVAVTEGRRAISNVIYSQVVIHKQWGGVVPSLAKRAHVEKIDFVIAEALKKAKIKMENIDFIAVTQGPGLAPALEVGINKAKELATKYKKKLISVNHMEGHLYSPFVQNSKGNPSKDIVFPLLGFLVSGGHTEIILWKDHLKYEVLGETLDDAAGEALDKAAKLMGLGYPGGEVLERLARDIDNVDEFKFTRPMLKSGDLNYSFSGLKTALLYKYKGLSDNEKINKLKSLASSFQEAVFDSLLIKLKKAIVQTGCSRIACGGGVMANKYLRKKLRSCLYDLAGRTGRAFFPPYKYLTGDNAAMIGVVAGYKAERGMFVEDFDSMDRLPRMRLG